MDLATLTAVLTIVVIDLTISGDNALVIGMAAHRLQPAQRRMAILLGAAGAIGLRILFTALAAVLLSIPLLQAVGGVILAWIAFKLLREGMGSEADHNVKEATTLRQAVQVIILADVVMSLDNILAVAGASHGNLLLLLFGLGLSLPIVMFGSSLVAGLMQRARWLIYVGAGVLVWTSAQMILEDHVIDPYLPNHWAMEPGLTVLMGAALLLVSLSSIRKSQLRVKA